MSGEPQTHVVGAPMTWTNEAEDSTILRQRCSWCGALLDEVDLARTMVQIDPDDPDASREYPTWPVGALMRTEGVNPTVRSILAEQGDDIAVADIAPDSCFLIDPQVTS